MGIARNLQVQELKVAVLQHPNLRGIPKEEQHLLVRDQDALEHHKVNLVKALQGEEVKNQAAEVANVY